MRDEIVVCPSKKVVGGIATDNIHTLLPMPQAAQWHFEFIRTRWVNGASAGQCFSFVWLVSGEEAVIT